VVAVFAEGSAGAGADGVPAAGGVAVEGSDDVTSAGRSAGAGVAVAVPTVDGASDEASELELPIAAAMRDPREFAGAPGAVPELSVSPDEVLPPVLAPPAWKPAAANVVLSVPLGFRTSIAENVSSGGFRFGMPECAAAETFGLDRTIEAGTFRTAFG